MCGGFLGSVGNAVGDVAGGIADLGQSAINTVSDAGSSIDDAVNSVIPGGWGTVAAAVAAYLSGGSSLAAEGAAGAADAGAAGAAGAGAATGAADAGAGLASLDAGAGSVFPDAAGFTPNYGVGADLGEGLAADYAAPAAGVSSTGVPLDVQNFGPGDVSGEGIPADYAAPAANSSLLSNAATALKYAGLANLIAGAVAPKQTLPGTTAQAPVGAYLSPNYKADRYKPYAMGGLTALAAGGGPVEQMSDANAVGANTGFPMANIMRGAYATPYQQPISQNVLTGGQDGRVDPYTGEEKLAGGGITNLGGYSDGGRLLRGPGDGVSDSIPAVIGNRQPARLADGEFVVPARIVSELGNGSTEAGARQLYAMMDRIQKARSKTVGKGKMAANTQAAKHLPA